MKSINHDEPLAELQQLSKVSAPPALVAKVMQEIERPAPFQFWNWLYRPRAIELRLSPLATLAAVFLLTISVWAIQRTDPTPSVASRPALPVEPEHDAEVVLVRFVLSTQGAQTVAVAGDFNGWDPQATPLQMQPQSNVFAVTLPLRKGQTYQYMFMVDGQWVTDPSAEMRPDGFGQHNSLLRL